MRTISRASFVWVMLSLLLGVPDSRTPNDKSPKLDELLAVLRSNLTNLTEEQLNAAAVKGLLDHWAARRFWILPIRYPNPRFRPLNNPTFSTAPSDTCG